MMNSIPGVTSFPGDKTHKAAYPAFKVSVNSWLGVRNLLGFVLPEVEYTHIRGEPFVPQPHPGPKPGPASQAWGGWKYSSELYEREQGELRKATETLLSVLDTDTTNLFIDPAYPHLGAATRSLQWMLLTMEANYGALASIDVDAMRAHLDKPYVAGHNFVHFLTSHREAHIASAGAQAPLSEYDKVSKLKEALKPCGFFTTSLELFSQSYPRVADQTFERLASIVTNTYNSRDHMATTRSVGFAGAAIATSMSTDALKALIQTTIRSEMQQAKLMTTATRPDTKQHMYCWTHGPNLSHNGTECKWPAEGHIATATLGDQKGGKPMNNTDKHRGRQNKV